MTGRELGVYSHLSDADIETALSTLGELADMGVDDFADGDLSSRQYEVMNAVHSIWLEGQQ